MKHHIKNGYRLRIKSMLHDTLTRYSMRDISKLMVAAQADITVQQLQEIITPAIENPNLTPGQMTKLERFLENERREYCINTLMSFTHNELLDEIGRRLRSG